MVLGQREKRKASWKTYKLILMVLGQREKRKASSHWGHIHVRIGSCLVVTAQSLVHVANISGKVQTIMLQNTDHYIRSMTSSLVMLNSYQAEIL